MADDVPCYMQTVSLYTIVKETKPKAPSISRMIKTAECEVYFVDLPALFHGDEVGYTKYDERLRGIHRRLDAVINRC